MLKIVGILTLISSGILAGNMAALKLSARVRFIEEYMEFIKTLQNEIRYSGSHLEDILKEQNGNGVFYQALKKCLGYMNCGEAFPVAWKKTFSYTANNLPISKTLSEIIVGFGLRLGTTDVDGQISNCEYSYESAIPYLQKAREEKRTKEKLYQIFGVCIGATIALFLI